MKLIIIRHADPDYSIDSLTPTGWEEARLLAERVAKWEVKAVYTSPLGRAKDTAGLSLNKLGMQVEVKDWLREFPIRVPKNGREDDCAWDWLPADWTPVDAYYHPTDWMETPAFAQAGAKEAYRRVTDGLDALLETHGYRREGRFYRAVHANSDTVVLLPVLISTTRPVMPSLRPPMVPLLLWLIWIK